MMTDKIAFELGEWNLPSFYSQAIWVINREPFKLEKFFNWWRPMLFNKYKNSDSDEIEESFYQIYGSLKFDAFTKISHKLAYIRGKLKSYGSSISETEITVYWANSYDFQGFFAQCLQDVILDKFVLEAPGVSGGRLHKQTYPKFTIQKTEIMGGEPGTPSVKLIADKEIIDYLVNYEMV